MIHPKTVMKMLGERKTFIRNHPDFFGFFLKIFGGKVEAGTRIEIRVTKPGKDAETASAVICDTDLKLLQAVRELVNSL